MEHLRLFDDRKKEPTTWVWKSAGDIRSSRRKTSREFPT